MWEYAKHVKLEEIIDTASDEESEEKYEKRMKYFDLADYIESTGLGDWQVALLMMLAPLTERKKNNAKPSTESILIAE